MNEIITNLRHAVDSLQKLEDICGPSKRSANGVLDDLSEWLNESLDSSTRLLYAFLLQQERDDTWKSVNSINNKLLGLEHKLRVTGFIFSLGVVSGFIREDLEDCILGLQTAIQILEEEAQNNE